ncbi:hypothetical protein ACFQPF_16215 [Fictibacillus iocasae]|uniref:Uncharacterized protein n=1 Tax=Fictibacillus iocasae TaxID=2715437 RepID=A0ABW2NRJ9_9BACL
MNKTDSVKQELLYLMGSTHRNYWFVSLENSVQDVIRIAGGLETEWQGEFDLGNHPSC